MGEYSKVMEEIDSGIRDLQKLKETLIMDSVAYNKKKYATRYGSAAMFNRSKLNIRDNFRRIGRILDWNFGGCSYYDLVKEGAAALKEGDPK